MAETDPSPDRRRLLRLAALAGVLAPAGVAVAQEDDDDDERTTDDGEEGGTTTEDDEGRTTTDDGRTTEDDDGDDDEEDLLESGAGLVTVRGGDTVPATVTCLEAAIEQEGLTLVTTVDHAASAGAAGLDLPPTTLLVFGNPEAGTPLMQESRSIGIDLPQKLLVWEDDDGVVRVTYNDPLFLADRHDVEEQDERLLDIAETLERVATSCQS